MYAAKWGSALLLAAVAQFAVAGCAGGGLGTTPGTPLMQARTASWMAPDAKKVDLLYVTDIGDNYVYVFSYPVVKQLGTLTGFNNARGACTDKKGDIFITNRYSFNYTTPPQILEYAHGGTSPIASLGDYNGQPNDCSVDEKSGRLAVATWAKYPSYAGPGSVSIYKDAQGTPTTYSVPGVWFVVSCAYDPKGNLFVDGMPYGYGSYPIGFVLAELPKGSIQFANLSVNASLASAGGIQWDGKYVAVDDNTNNIVYQLSVAGSTATVEGTTDLKGDWDYEQIYKFAVPHSKHGQATVLIGGNQDAGVLGFWDYPAGGSPTSTIGGLDAPVAAVISKGKGSFTGDAIERSAR
jgi:hypothetical protein